MAVSEAGLVLLVVDPYLVHCYWHLSPALQCKAVLRFHRQSGDSFDVEIDPQAGNWYVPLWSPEQSLYAELMIKPAGGPLKPLARSNVVHLPRSRPVTTIQQHFIKVEPEDRRAEVVPPPAAAQHTPLEDRLAPVETTDKIPVIAPPSPADADLVSIAEAKLFPGLSSWR